ncbi:PEP-CTERM sorting domain-containing protein [Moritella viscosa]
MAVLSVTYLIRPRFGVGVASVPEPSTLAIFCLCILGLATRARKGV